MAKQGFKQRYLEKFTRYPRQTHDEPHPETFISIVIPCLNEPHILQTLESLWACDPPEYPVEVLVSINHSREAPSEIQEYNRESYEAVATWAQAHQSENFRVIPLWFPSIKPKIAGVGTARKVGMDEAVYRFYAINQPKGVIVCLDADCTVASNYLQALENHFRENPQSSGCSIYFEHPLEGPDRQDLYQAILDFELYLRYYKNAFAWCGFPYAYHTIGSVMAVPCDIYQKIGGMNKQKAGEDFYFLEKVIYQGHFTELNATCVYPSPRKSLRVPFGTGQAVTDFIEDRQYTIDVFHPNAYRDFKGFVENVPVFYRHSPHWQTVFQNLPESVRAFLQYYDYAYYLTESLQHASSEGIFLKRFFHWFNAFMALKYLHFARDHYYPDIPVKEGVGWLSEKLGLVPDAKSSYELLLDLRGFDQKGGLSLADSAPF